MNDKKKGKERELTLWFGWFTADMFLRAVRGANENGDISSTEVGNLKYWGLLEQTDDVHHPEIYKLKKFGRDFLRGALLIPEVVTVKNGTVIESSPKRVTLKDALGGGWDKWSDWIREWRALNSADKDGQMDLFNGIR